MATGRIRAQDPAGFRPHPVVKHESGRHIRAQNVGRYLEIDGARLAQVPDYQPLTAWDDAERGDVVSNYSDAQKASVSYSGSR
jgi:hypothetical protein